MLNPFNARFSSNESSSMLLVYVRNPQGFFKPAKLHLCLWTLEDVSSCQLPYSTIIWPVFDSSKKFLEIHLTRFSNVADDRKFSSSHRFQSTKSLEVSDFPGILVELVMVKRVNIKKSDSLEIKEKQKHENPNNCEPFLTRKISLPIFQCSNSLQLNNILKQVNVSDLRIPT